MSSSAWESTSLSIWLLLDVSEASDPRRPLPFAARKGRSVDEAEGDGGSCRAIGEIKSSSVSVVVHAGSTPVYCNM
jgi:hypothetical protein